MPKFELFGSANCGYTAELREWLEWSGREFTEFDVEQDAAALDRMRRATGGLSNVPVLLQDGQVAQIGWQGRSCFIGPGK